MDAASRSANPQQDEVKEAQGNPYANFLGEAEILS